MWGGGGEDMVLALTLPERSTNGTRTNGTKAESTTRASKDRGRRTLVVFLRHFLVGLLLPLLASLLHIQIRIPNLTSTSSGFMNNDNDNDHFTTTPLPRTRSQPHSHPSSAPHSSEAAADEHDLEALGARAPQTQPPMQNEQRHTPPPHRPRLAHTRELRLSSSRLGFIFVRG
ncbi:hypothetical protein B0H13DRAFT_2001851 [Mycena leptocephala]|nr:hypothetical protein B0H13DRAFT_2001851 [Mycena leptocephala]